MSNDRDVVLFRIDRKVGLLILAALGVVLGGFALAEQLTLTTSYPVPSGIYNQLITTGNSGVVPADTTLNRNAGNTILVPNATNAGGRVGVGTAAPSAKLHVMGTFKVVDGSEGAGKVMTSDAVGAASWQAPGGPDFETIIAVAAGGSYSVPHGLGSRPGRVMAFYCRDAACAGTNISLDRNRFVPGGDHGAQIGFSGVNIFVRVGGSSVYLSPEWVDGGAPTAVAGFYRLLAWR